MRGRLPLRAPRALLPDSRCGPISRRSLGMSNPELLDFIWMDTIREMPTRTRTTINLGATAAFKGQV